MANKKRKNPDKLAGKYVVRRLFLVLALIVLAAAGLIYIGYSMAGSSSDSNPAGSSESQADTQSSLQSGPDSVSSSVSEAEPSGHEPETPAAISAHLDDWNMILVNKENHLPEDFSVELETVVGDFKVDARIKEPLLRMIAGAREDGIVLLVCSAYRDPEYQAVLFENQINEQMKTGLSREQAVIAAATVVANPGTSEHHTGLAVDIVTQENQNLDESFAATPAFAWLSDNAADYGFVLRYPKDKENITNIIYEPWHYRYVGVDTARDINDKAVCLEEYVDMLANPPVNDSADDESKAE